MFEELARIFSEDNNAVAQRELLVRCPKILRNSCLPLQRNTDFTILRNLCLPLQGGDGKVCRDGRGEGSPLAKGFAEAR